MHVLLLLSLFNFPSLLAATIDSKPPASTTALVLSGGGAKGAYQVGVLKALCSTEWANQWQMITGSSIGALNGLGLAQFNQSEQCSHGVPFLETFWTDIKTQNDVFVAPSPLLGGASCMSGFNAVGDLEAFYAKGGLCDPSPGANHLRATVNAAHVKASDVRLYVPAVDMTTASVRWFTDQDSNVVEGSLASGSLAPFLLPMHIDAAVFVDGGIAHNTPVLKALQEGADRLLVLLLAPTDRALVAVPVLSAQAGVDVLSFYLDYLSYNQLFGWELAEACRDYPDAEIMGLAPPGLVGGLLDFDSEAIAKMMAKGVQDAQTHAPQDLCAMLPMMMSNTRTPASAAGISVWALVAACAASLAAGSAGTWATLRAYRRCVGQGPDRDRYDRFNNEAIPVDWHTPRPRFYEDQEELLPPSRGRPDRADRLGYGAISATL